MLDEQSEENQERGSQLAVAVGLLLFASVVLGSGVLGDSGDARLSEGEEGADDADADPATDREQMANGLMDVRSEEGDFSWEDCLGNDRPFDVPADGMPGEDEPRDVKREGKTDPNTDADAATGADRPNTAGNSAGTPMSATGTTAAGQITFTVDRTDAVDAARDPCAGMFTNAAGIFGMNGMHGANTGQALQSMFDQMCEGWVHGEFWGNIGGDVERSDDGSISITTVDDTGAENTDTISPATAHALTAGLAPIVESCSDWMMMRAQSSMAGSYGNGFGNGFGHGGGHGWDQGHGDWDRDWYDECEEEDDWHDWETDEWDGEHDSDESDEHESDEHESDEHDANGEDSDADDGHEDEPRESRHAGESDRRHADWDPCADYHDWDHDWDDDWDEHDWEEAEPLMVEMWIETENGHGFWITFETYECAGVYDFVDDSGDVHTLEYDVCEDEEEYFAEEWYDEESNTWNAHWEDAEGSYWMVLNYETCTGVLEWVDNDGEDGREEWEMEDCGEHDESEDEECEHYNDHGECLDEDESEEHGEDESDEHDEESDEHGEGESDGHDDESDDESDEHGDDESDDESEEGSDSNGDGTAGGHR